MKRIILILLSLVPYLPAMAENDSYDPFAPLVATDIWTVQHEKSYDINFELGNTTGQTLTDFEVTFIPSFLPQTAVDVTNATVDVLQPAKKCHPRVSVALKTDADTITGYLASTKGDTISDPFLLFQDTATIIGADEKTALCFYASKDEEGGRYLYYFSIYANNARPYDINDFKLYLNQATDDGLKSRMEIPIARLEAGKRKYLATVLAFALDAKYARLWVTDERGIRLTDIMGMQLPDGDEEDFRAPIMGQDFVYTAFLVDENFIPETYTGDSLRAGQIHFTMPFYSGSPAEQFIWPQTAKGYQGLKDLYGHKIMYHDLSAGDFVDANKYSMESYTVPSQVTTLLRGGDYEYSSYLDFMGIDRKDTVRIYDVPTVRLDYKDPVIGDPLNMMICANTGYPYADSLKTCTPIMNYDLLYIRPVNGQAEGDTIDNWRNGRQTINFNLDRYPTLAGVDTVKVQVSDPDIGDYWLYAESDFKHYRRLTHVEVKDTVRMKIELQTSKFRKGIDSLATVQYYIDYRWPFVVPESGDSVPTVRFYASCYRDSLNLSSADSLLCDSLRSLHTEADSVMADSIIKANTIREYHVNDSLIIFTEPDTYLHVEGNFQFDITRLPVNRENSVEFTLRFNGEEQKKMTLGLTLTEQKLEVEGLESDAAVPEMTYDLDGRILPDIPERGIYIRQGKKFISR